MNAGPTARQLIAINQLVCVCAQCKPEHNLCEHMWSMGERSGGEGPRLVLTSRREHPV